MWCTLVTVAFLALTARANAGSWSTTDGYLNFGSYNGNIIEQQQHHFKNSSMQAVLPHDVYPGFEVMQFDTGGSKQPSSFQLLETGFSKFFTVLDNGIVMTTSDLMPLVNRPVNLIILEEKQNRTETHDLHLYVINRQNMLTFKHNRLGDGELEENSPAGTPIDGFPILHARGNFPVHCSILPDETGEQPFALAETHYMETGYNLTLRSPKQGIRVVSAKPLDRERKSTYKVIVHASDSDFISTSRIEGTVNVVDVNDNSPVFEQAVYNFQVSPTNLKELVEGAGSDVKPRWRRFMTIGRVLAQDADNDKVAYKLITPTNLIIIVPQTGELLLADEPDVAADLDTQREFLIEAHDIRTPSRTAESPARVIVRFLTSGPEKSELDLIEDQNVIIDRPPEVHIIQKRRVTRAVRPTKKIEFTEAEGDVVNKVVFNLEKENDKETYKIRDENKWVTVDTNGTVRVKQKWDYEELGPEKTIDFWVTITNSGEPLKILPYFYHFLALIKL